MDIHLRLQITFFIQVKNAIYLQNVRTEADQTNILYQFNVNVDLYESYPDDIVMWLQRFGGILALLKLGSLLFIYHKYQYFKGIDTYLRGQNGPKNEEGGKVEDPNKLIQSTTSHNDASESLLTTEIDP